MALTLQDKMKNRLLCDACTRLAAAEAEGRDMDEQHNNPSNIPPA
jgi:hypothetical protein